METRIADALKLLRHADYDEQHALKQFVERPGVRDVWDACATKVSFSMI